MAEAAFFILGFAACLALCWKRLRESRRAFNAARELVDAHCEREIRRRQTLLRMRECLGEIRDSLDGKALLPAPVNRTGQHFSTSLIRVTAGLPLHGQPRFSGGSACRSGK